MATPKPLGVTCDVSDEAQVAATIDRTNATYGRLHMAFNNAGIQSRQVHFDGLGGDEQRLSNAAVR